MRSTTVILVSLLASAAIAQPHHQHVARHQHNQHKRDNAVVWVTDWDYVTETVGITTTIWVSEGFVPPTTSSSSSSPSASAASVPAQFFQGASKAPSVPSSSTSSTSTSSTSSVYVAPAPVSTSTSEPTTSSEPAPAYVAPVEPSTSTSSTPEPSTPAPAAYTPPETTSAPAYTPPAETSTYVAPAPATSSASQSSSSSGGSSGGECSSGSPCDGDITFYDAGAGTGACGWNTDGSKENVVALPHGLMGTQSNGNPYCGKMVTIKCTSTGKTTTAKVFDKCMGCTGYSIDLSNAAFGELADFAVGRTDATWWFN